ncbi:MAG TPA: hypothetical protein VK188_15980 [Holophaga sp.]|nr:hypothetical protein [Holophaga sp.]
MRPGRTALLLLALSAWAACGAPDPGKLPGWAQAPAREGLQEAPPANAEAWVLLSRREVTYAGSGAIRVRHQRLVRVVGGRGLDEAYLLIPGLQDGSAQVRELRGWNLRPDGELVKLGSGDRASIGGTDATRFDNRLTAVALLPRVMEGSLVAFESEVEYRLVSASLAELVLERHPVRRWELRAGSRPGVFGGDGDVKIQIRTTQFSPWLAPAAPGSSELVLDRVPAAPLTEVGAPGPERCLPRVDVRFLDPQWPGSRILDAWSAFGGWYHGLFSPRAGPVASGAPAPGAGLPGLRALWRWFGEALVYKQVYITPDRGDVPETAAEVARKRYGDCKDLSCLFISLARGSGFEGFPVLARIQGGPVTAEEAQGPARDVFDHALVALRLERSLGLPAEVETAKGRFLLVDPTAPWTAFGQLPASHRNAQLLLCLPQDGVWAAVPAQAIQEGEMLVRLKGTVDADGQLTATVRLEEKGNQWGLRTTARGASAEAFRAYLEAECLDQALNGRLEVVAKGDPLDLDRPFGVDLKIVSPRALRKVGSDFLLLPGIGLPAIPRPFTAPGRKRLLPVHVRGGGRLRLEASLRLPWVLRSLEPQRTGETPFRRLAWLVATQASEGGCLLDIHVDHLRQDADFPLSRLAEAAEAWKGDRALVRALHEDALALRP